MVTKFRHELCCTICHVFINDHSPINEWLMTVGRWSFCPKHHACWTHVSISFDQNVWTTENNKSHNMLSAWWFSRRDFVPVYVENAPTDQRTQNTAVIKTKSQTYNINFPFSQWQPANTNNMFACCTAYGFPNWNYVGPERKNEWTYLCPDSWAMVKARPSPVSSLIVQLRYLLHIPLIGAKPTKTKKQQNMAGWIFIWMTDACWERESNWLFTETLQSKRSGWKP